MNLTELKRKTNNEYHEFIKDVMEMLRRAQETGEGVDLTTLPESAVLHLKNLDDYFESVKNKEEPSNSIPPTKTEIPKYVWLIGIGALCLCLGLLIGFVL